MARLLVGMLALVSLAGSAQVSSAAEGEASQDPLAPFGWFADLAGHCWSGTYPDGKTSDTQCYSVQFGRVLRGSIRLQGLHGGKPVENFEGDSVYAWNSKARRVDYSFWASDGTYGTGEMLVEGERIVFPPGAAAQAGAHPMRSVWRRNDPSSFTVTRERRSGDEWSPLFEVTYRRSAKL